MTKRPIQSIFSDLKKLSKQKTFKRKLSFKELIFGSLTFVGLIIIFSAEFDQLIGMSIAFLATLLSVFFTLLNSNLVKEKLSPITITFYELFFGWFLILLIW